MNNSGGNNKTKNRFRFDSEEKIPNLLDGNDGKIDSFIPKNIPSSNGIKPNIPTTTDIIKNDVKNTPENNKNNKGFSEEKLSNNFRGKDSNKKNKEVKVEDKNNKNIDKPDIDDDIEKIVFGLNDKGQKIYIPESSRFFNTLILGNKATGKTSGILPVLVEQDFKNKNYGCTIIVSKNEVAYNLYALAKNYKRDVIILKPSVSNEIGNKFLWKQDYSYDYINEYIINYKEAIKKRQIVIIDMEILKHKSDGLRAVAMLLLQLQLDMQETDITLKKPHFLYIDDGQYYLPFLEYLFTFGDNYNIGINLFLQSRSQLVKNDKNYSAMVDNNIRNILLLNSLDKRDIEYYRDRLYEYKQSNVYYNRDINEILYETINIDNKRKCGVANYKELQTIDWTFINNKAKSIRSRLLKEKRKELEKEMLLSIKSKYEYSDGYYEDNNAIELSPEEIETIDEVEKELFDVLDSKDFDNYDEIGEPTPIDINLILTDENNPNINPDNVDKLDIKSHIEKLKEEKPENKVDKNEKIKFKEEKIKEIIKIKEKSIKRNVSTKIFNNLVSDINYCDDNFDFKFD